MSCFFLRTSQRLAKLELKSVNCLGHVLVFLVMSMNHDRSAPPRSQYSRLSYFISVIINNFKCCLLNSEVLEKRPFQQRSCCCTPVKHWSNWVEGVFGYILFISTCFLCSLAALLYDFCNLFGWNDNLKQQDASVSMLCVLPAGHLGKNRI